MKNKVVIGVVALVVLLGTPFLVRGAGDNPVQCLDGNVVDCGAIFFNNATQVLTIGINSMGGIGGLVVRGVIKDDYHLYTKIGAGIGKVIWADVDALGIGISAPTAGVDINSPKPITYSCQSKTAGRGCCEKREFSNGQGSFYRTYENVNGVVVEHDSIQTPVECQFQP